MNTHAANSVPSPRIPRDPLTQYNNALHNPALGAATAFAIVAEAKGYPLSEDDEIVIANIANAILKNRATACGWWGNILH